MSVPGRWADLLPRTLSAIVMIVVGAVAVTMGGIVFAVLVALACGGVLWELFRMIEPTKAPAALSLAVVTAVTLFVATLAPPFLFPLLFAIPMFVGAMRLTHARVAFLGLAAWVMVGALGLIWLRNIHGLSWELWLVSVVVSTDVAGYFVGKYIGGPKVWPRISPKKTWSGTVGGWLAALLVSLAFVLQAGLSWHLLWLSVPLSMASQLGDIVESAIKRRTGVKDSSRLIPGHGGLFDRFDGMLGASALCFLVVLFWG